MDRKINKRIKRDYVALFDRLTPQNKQIFYLLQANLDYYTEALYKKIELKCEVPDLSMREPFLDWLREDSGYSEMPYSRIELKTILYLDMTPNLYFFLQKFCQLEHIEITYENLTAIDNKIWLSKYIAASNSEKDNMSFDDVGSTAKKAIDCYCNVLDGWKSHFSSDGFDENGVPLQFNHWFHTLKIDFNRWLHSYGGKRMSSIDFQNEGVMDNAVSLYNNTGNPETDLAISMYKESIIKEIKVYKPTFLKYQNSKYSKETKRLSYLFLKDFMIDSSHYCSKSSGKFKMNTWYNCRFPNATKQAFERFKKLKPALEQMLYAFMALCERKGILDGEQIVLFEGHIRKYKEVAPTEASVSLSYDKQGLLSRDNEARLRTFARNVLFTPEKMEAFKDELSDLNRQETRYFDMLTDINYFKSVLEELSGQEAKPYEGSPTTFMISAEISYCSISPRINKRYNSIMSQSGGYSCYKLGNKGKFDWCAFLGIQPKRGALIRSLAYRMTHS